MAQRKKRSVAAKPKSVTVPLYLRIPPDLSAALEERRRRKFISINAFLNDLLRREFSEELKALGA